MYDDDLDEEAFFAAWAEAHADAAAVLREALSPHRKLPPPPDIDAVGEQARQRIKGNPSLEWVRKGAGLGRDLNLPSQLRLNGEDVLWELAAATIEVQEDPGLDPEQQAALMVLGPADWLGAIVEAVRAGPGSSADPRTLVRHIDRCPEIEGPPADPDDAELLVHAFEVRMPAWEALGLLDDSRRLTEIGAWLLPRAACSAWDSDFDHPEDDLGEDDDPFDDEGLGASPFDDEADNDLVDPAVAELASDFATWSQEQGITASDEWVATLLDLRLTFLDDDLVSWRQDDLRELFLEVCPRKLGVGSAEMREAVASFATFLEFLADIGLDERSDPVDTLTAWLRHAIDTVIAAMDDPARWGPARALSEAMAAEGIDLGDPAAVEAWVAAFNERPFEERDAVLGPMGPAVDLPMQMLPADEKLAELVRATTVWQQITGLLTYVGEKLPVTDAGNLKVADARKLVEQLDTGDVLDPVWWPGAPPQKTRSSQELRHLTRTFELAQEAGLLERQGRNVRPQVERVAAMREAPLVVWEALVVTWLRAGFLGALNGDRRMAWADELDGVVIDLLMAAVASDEPLPLDRLAQTLADDSPFPAHRNDAMFAEWLRDDVHRWALELQAAGLVEVQDMRITPQRQGRPRRHRGKVVATPLAALLLARVAGAPVHRQGALRAADAATLLDTVIRLPIELAQAELGLWLSDREADVAAGEIAASLAGADRERIMAAMLAFDLVGAPARSALEGLQADPIAGTFARAWLVQHGYLEIEPGAEGEAALDTMLGVLATLAQIGPDAVVNAIEQLGEPTEQIAFVEQAWRASVPETTAILDAIGDLHPDKGVRKAARKAVFKRRSAGR
jgi:hypothetical protein